MRKYLLISLLFIFGCRNVFQLPQGIKYAAVGYVRSLYCYNSSCTTVFEGENKVVFNIHTIDIIPPVWIGMHVEISYETCAVYQDECYKNLQVVKRLPD